MDNIANIFSILQKSGITPTRYDDNFLYILDPSCVHNFLTNPIWNNMSILDIGWTIIVCFTGIIIFGWAIAFIRGVQNNIFSNLKNLALILTIISALYPIVNVIYGAKLNDNICKEIPISRDNIQTLLEKAYPSLDIIDAVTIIEDSGPIFSDTGTASSYVNRIQQTQNQNYSQNSRINSSKNVIYTNSEGVRIKHTGGSLAWRNNNPGNIIMGDFAKQYGAVQSNGRFAVFPDAQAGKRAVKALLNSNSYRNLTISEAIHRWCPWGDGNNNPDSYVKRVRNLTNLNPSQAINTLTTSELDAVANAIQTVEGWIVGTEEVLS
ncbi:MAG: hypothetical protein MJ156_00895 [Alphaproteobacteria bacterium]|nr:hypothetical protein [Alphaproteobacteria bacterium]